MIHLPKAVHVLLCRCLIDLACVLNADLKDAFHEAVDDYVETCARIGKEPQKSHSGKMMFRVKPEVHRRAAIAAELAGVSLNQWAEEALEKSASAIDGYAETGL